MESIRALMEFDADPNILVRIMRNSFRASIHTLADSLQGPHCTRHRLQRDITKRFLVSKGINHGLEEAGPQRAASLALLKPISY